MAGVLDRRSFFLALETNIWSSSSSSSRKIYLLWYV